MSIDSSMPVMASTKEEEENFCYAMQLVTSVVLSMSMKLAVELGVFDIIAKAGGGVGLSSSQIAAQIGTENPEAPMMLDRILRLLASHSVLNCTVINTNDDDHSDRPNFHRVYSLAHVSKYFVKSDENGVSLGALMALNQDKVFLDSWFQLKGAVMEGGIPFNRVYGTHLFEYPGLDARFNQLFNTAMFDHTTIVIKKILDLYKGFEHLKQLVDVGGGLGVTLSLITSRYPDIKGINFDLPHVIKDAPSYTGVDHVGGDMFASVPSGDAIFMKCYTRQWKSNCCGRTSSSCARDQHWCEEHLANGCAYDDTLPERERAK
ncbi:caffeic acid 3-O-methyltransferase isoform X2 [Rosa chinensis]|uniref:caffeic acid 3-O-methyltransferase isoform X2 n=1 Tax=Rosa chinensis TaxID=74649 RepID=UPI001AD8D086|nr:caffeic acid 3-O-methyltransferase isoform X2 [Rosa chinensis]